MADHKSMIAEILSQMNGGEVKDPAQVKALIVRSLIETMPDDIKGQAATSPEAITLAIDAAMEISSRIGAEMMFKLITDPTSDHKCEFGIRSLAGVCHDRGIPVRAGEGIPAKAPAKTDEKSPMGFRPTQAPAKA